MGHWHDPEDGYANIEEACDYENDQGRPYDDADTLAPSPPPLFSPADILHLGSLSRQTRIDMAVLRYQHNLVAFLRMHRAVAVIGNGPDCAGASSASPTATKHFEKLARCLAPLHRLDYVTPALVALALRKIYLHRIRIIRGTKTDGYGDGVSRDALHERSMQWGSSRAAVEAVLEGITPEDVIEDVLQVVPAPL